MAMNAGSVDGTGTGSGLSKEIYDIISKKLDTSGGTPAQELAANQRIADFCNAISKAVVDHIKTNAVVSTTGTATGVTTGQASANTTGTGTIE